MKYDRQRARPAAVQDWSGRLAMILLTGAGSQSRWADRQRWTLESRLQLLPGKAEEAAKDRISARGGAAEQA